MHDTSKISKDILEVFDLDKLQERIDKADWFYEYSDDASVWVKALREIKDIEKELMALAVTAEGKSLANILWDTGVPIFSINKPFFLMEGKGDDLQTRKINKMKEKNLDYLEQNLKALGFGDSLNAQLKKNIQEQIPEFSLQHQAEYNSKKMDMLLQFKKSNETEKYFFNRYKAELTEDPTRQQTFYLDKGNGITAKEAFNLLEGRAVYKTNLVNKTGEKYNTWVELHFDQKLDSGNFKVQPYHDNYGYKLGEALDPYPIKELGDPKEKEMLIKSLEKGNQQSVKMEIGGKTEMHFIQADPHYKGIAVYNTNNTKLDKKQVDALKAAKQPVEPDQKQDQKQSVKAEPVAEDEGPELKKKRNRKNGMKV